MSTAQLLPLKNPPQKTQNKNEKPKKKNGEGGVIELILFARGGLFLVTYT